MAGITTAMPTSFKAEVLQCGHCFNATVTPTGNVTNTSNSVASVSSMLGIAGGMTVTGTGVPASTYIVPALTGSTFIMSQAGTATNVGVTLTISGDVFKIALIKHTPTGTYGAASVNYTDITGNSDEVSGTGYTATGLALTNVTPLTSGTGAYTNFSPNPSWAGATIDSDGCMIYNTSTRLGGTSGTNTTGAGRACGIYSFGGEQKVTAGTFTVVMPTAAPATAVIAIQ